MNGEWQTVEIGSLCDGIFDGPHATPSKTESGPIFLGISSLNKGRIDLSEPEYLSETDYVRWTRRVEPRKGDVVFSYETRLGEAAIIPQGLRCCLGRRMALMRPNTTRVNPRFLLYAFLGPDFQDTIRSRTIHGSTVDRIPLIEFPRFLLRLPSKPTQDRIADTLGSLDDKIELNRRTNETLETMARTLFRSWFVDFDPVRAKVDGEQPHGMDAATAKLFPNRFEESALGDIPQGWKVVPLPDAITVNPSRSLPKDSVAPYLEMGNMPTASARALAWEPRACGSGAKFVNGDVLLARITPCLENGKTAFVDFLADGQVGWGSTEYIVFRSKPPLPPEYAYFLARSPELRTHAIQNMTGTSGRQRVPAECFNGFPVVVPPEPVAKKFGEFARSVMAKMKAHDEESATLGVIRDSLLPKLLAGELSTD